MCKKKDEETEIQFCYFKPTKTLGSRPPDVNTKIQLVSEDIEDLEERYSLTKSLGMRCAG